MLALTINGTTESLSEDRQDEAMRRFWEAKEAGDATARLERGNTLTLTATLPGQVSQVAEERVRIQEANLARNGFSVPPAIYAPGTRVVELGDDNFRLERRRVEALPAFASAAAAACAEIHAEDRRDLEVPIREIAMDDRGLLNVNDEYLAMETVAFQQLCSLGGFGTGARYLADLCDSALRAQNVNAQLAKRSKREVVLRTRAVAEGGRTVFAAVTPTYAAVDTDEVLEAVAGQLTEANVELVYDGTGVQATALFMPDAIVDLAAGDVFKVGIRLATDDTGRGRVRVTAVVWRNRCLNLIVLGVGTVETFSAVHRGERDDILARLTAGVEDARNRVGDFLEAWGLARLQPVDVPVTVRTWVEEKRLGQIPVKDRDRAVAEILRSWEHEPGHSLADAVNAVTRSAHESDWWSRDLRQELEERAARLVLVPR